MKPIYSMPTNKRHTHVTPIAHYVATFKRAQRPWLARLWGKIDTRNNNMKACWKWRGFIDPQGQPKLRWGQSYKSAHRLVYEQVVGPIGDKHLRWTCETIACMNPEHMVVGGNKRTYATPKADKVRAEAKLFALVGFSTNQLAKLLGVAPKTITRALEEV